MLTSTNHLPARRRAQLTLNDVSVTRGATSVLNHVDLVVSPTTRAAIVGENGRGKSTLLHILAGTLPPDSGDVQRIGTLGLGEQEMSTTGRRTIGDAVPDAVAQPRAALAALDTAAHALAEGTYGAADEYSTALEYAEALDAWDAERRVQIALEALNAESDATKLLGDLSVGQRYRVRLACLLGANDDFLLLDEPTNHLDRSGLDFLTEQLRTRAGGLVIVSHDRALLSDVAETIIDLDPTPDGRPRASGNGFSGYREGRRAERERWEQDYDRQQTDHTRLQNSLSAAQNRLVSGWRPEKGTNKHGRATRAGGFVQNVHRRQEALEAHAITVPEPPLTFRFPELPTRADAALLTIDQVSVTGRLQGPVSFTLSQKDRLIVTGPNGAGKSTLLQVAAGELQPDTGSSRTTHGTRVGYLHQETVLPADRRASEVFEQHINALMTDGILTSSTALGLSQLRLLRPRETGKRVNELSMGQQRRLDLALVLAGRPHVLLLDEPTNHLSIALVDELTEALQVSDAAVVLSTHDRQLLLDTATWPRLEVESMAGGELNV